MAGVNDKAEIGTTGKFLEGVSVDTPAGDDLFREGVVASDPEDAQARARVRNAEPLADDYGGVVRVPGLMAALASILALVQSWFAKKNGTWGYRAGTTGTPDLPEGARVISISAAASTSQPGSYTINGGDSIVVPLGNNFTLTPEGNLVDPVLVFTDTASYVVEFVQ